VSTISFPWRNRVTF